jgi:hypothetical protein
MERISLISRQLVLKKLAVAFPNPSEAAEAQKSLDRYGQRQIEVAKDLVHLAIIKLSEGKLWRVRELVRLAKKDPRDVLFPSEAPEEFRQLQNNPPPHWGELRNYKKYSPTKQAAMEKRDHRQWLDWLAS